MPIIRGHCPGELVFRALLEVKPRKRFDNEPHYAHPPFPSFSPPSLLRDSTSFRFSFLLSWPARSARFATRRQFLPLFSSLLFSSLLLCIPHAVHILRHHNTKGMVLQGNAVTFAFSRRRVTRLVIFVIWICNRRKKRCERKVPRWTKSAGNKWQSVTRGISGIVKPVRRSDVSQLKDPHW